MTIEEEIKQKLQNEFNPLHLEVDNESHMHNVPEGSESHFKVTLVTGQFNGLPLIRRHRAVNHILKESGIQNAIHALALHTMTPEEWFARGGKTPESPPCLGGSHQAIS